MPRLSAALQSVLVLGDLVFDLPVVLIMLLGFAAAAAAAATMLGLLPAVRPADVLLPLLLLPIVFTARLPGEVFFTGTTTLLHQAHTHTQRHSEVYPLK